MDEMTVGIWDKDEVPTLEKVVVEAVADDISKVVPGAVVMPVTELGEEDEVIEGTTIVTTVLI
jgi:hypothetical protein